MNRIRNFLSLSFLLTAAILANGCSTGTGTMTPAYRYGNPDYRHVSELPQLQADAGPAERTAADLPPELSADEYELLGDALRKQRNYTLAYLQYSRSLEKNPGNIRVEHKIGLTYLAAGKLDNAIEQFQSVLDRSPGRAAAWEGMGRAYFGNSDYEAAEQSFGKALDLDSRLWGSHIYLGYICDIRKAPAQAIAHYHSALAIKPENGRIYNNLGVSYSMLGRFPEAVEAFEAAIENKYTASKVFNNLGLALAHYGRYTDALQAFKRGVSAPIAYNNLGMVHLKARHYDAAISCFETAIELDPQFNGRASENLKIARLEKRRASARRE